MFLHLHSELIALAIHHGDLSRLDPMKDLETIVAQIRWQAARMNLIADALEADRLQQLRPETVLSVEAHDKAQENHAA